MAPLVGTYPHTLDPKGRLVLPAKFRNHFGESLYVTPATGCLRLYTAEGFQEMMERLTKKAEEGELTQTAWRAVAAHSEEVRQDSQGRILLPTQLREAAALERDVVVTGVFNRLEVWDAERWRAMAADMQRAVDEELSGALGV